MVFKGLRFARAEVRNTTANTAIKVAMVAISIIPLLYGALYLFAFLDPYEQLNTVPVAVVNEDMGADVGDNFRVVGDDVVERLKDNNDGLGWNFVSASEAKAGLQDGTYYMTCTIPADFTKTIASADSDAPQAAQLVVEYNETKNMLASQVGGTVWKEVRQQVSDSVAQEYWETVFDEVNSGADQIQEAADGAADLQDGLSSATSGSKEITDNLNTLHSGTGDLAEGLGTLSSGAATLQTGTSDLANGADTLSVGTARLASGAQDLTAGTSALKDGAHNLADGGASLASGVSQLAQGTSDLESGAVSLANGVNQLQSQGSEVLAAGTKELRKRTSQLPDEQKVKQAKDASDQIAGGLNSVADGLDQLKGNAQEGKGLAFAAAASHQLATDLADTSSLDSGVDQLQAGLSQIQEGRSSVAAGTQQVEVALDGAQQQANAALAALATIDASTLDPAAQTALTQAIALLDANQGGACATLRAASAGLGAVEGGLADGGSLDTGLSQIDAGLSNLKTTADESLAQASSGAAQIADGLDAAVASIGSAQDIQTLAGGVAALQAGYASFSSQLLPLAESFPALAAAIAQIDEGAAQVDTNLKTATNGAQRVASGAGQVNAGAQSASSGATKLSAGAASLEQGAAQVDSGAGQLSSGVSQVNAGAASLASGASQVNSGAKQLASGATEARDGAGKLEDGAAQLADGSDELTAGLKEALDGSSELASGLADGASGMRIVNTQQKAEVFASPVQLDDEYFTTVKNYGTGFAPYFIALGLWVGALMGSFVFKPLNKRLILSGGNSAMVAYASYIPAALLSVVQVLLLLAVLQFGLDLQIDNVPLYYAFGIFTALVFAAIMQMLMAAFGFPGKFIAIILLMLQLTSAAGTFPIEQTPAFFQAVSPYLPMTYVVSGMRQVMTGTDMGVVVAAVGVLAAFGVGSFLVTTLTARAKRMVTMEDLHPVLDLG